MKKGYIPKDQRKKILFLSDDIRTPSGIGVMSREIVEGTAHRYNWVQIGASPHDQAQRRIMDMADPINKSVGIDDASVRIYPVQGYGNSNLLRQIIKIENPDALLIFTDPRYWLWLFQIEHEIRQHRPIFYYNIWDNLPYCFFNRSYYRSVDTLFAISKQTYNINKCVLGDGNFTLHTQKQNEISV